MNRRAKIVATIGPSTGTKEKLREAVLAGLNVARLNFSHGEHSLHKGVIDIINELRTELKLPIAILQDLQGPKIRVGRFKNGVVELKEGELVKISPDYTLGETGLIPTDFDRLPEVCRAGTKILLDDGLIELQVKTVLGREIECIVIFGGQLKDRKGMNVPGANLPVNCLTEKDLDDLEFGLSHGVDYIALSFVRQAKDIEKLRDLVKAKAKQTKIIAKIEMAEAIENLEAIVKASDAIMVARGDLAVEVGQTLLPGIQKKVISMANKWRKPVVTATQMLDSMVNNPQPTRAEITDVANAILDGSDALMLSAETASGKYPIKCIKTMASIITQVEKESVDYYKLNLPPSFSTDASAIAASACLCAQRLNAKVIVCLSTSGKTATLISNFRPHADVIAVTGFASTLHRLGLVWGVEPLLINRYKSSDDAMLQIQEILIQKQVVQPGDKVILTLGVPVMEGTKTNSLRVFTIS